MNCLIQKLKPLLEKYSVTAYVAGHDHSLQHIVTEHTESSLNYAREIPLHYIVSGAASRSDHSVANIHTIPKNSLRFRYPVGLNPFSQIGFSNGGYVIVNIEREKAILKFYSGKGNEKYSCTIMPRNRFTANTTS
ncbi:unnamed protein product [Thelazia callipaeda]|uniref:Metallophos_C domain-containing protein n=1 Tax=Thelazia callipaeda TaxID=103827 RepID=A0A0N5D6D1_THECL|nr:unnamed protein product [Thelazia callipaeda]